MDKYFEMFDVNRIKKGKELYDNGGVMYVLNYNNKYYSKVLGQIESYYLISIYNNNFDCTCDDTELCKHIYSTLLSINDNNYKMINLKDLTKNDLLDLFDYCIQEDFTIIDIIKEYLDEDEDENIIFKNNIFKNIKNNIFNNIIKEYIDFFEEFELTEFDNLTNDNDFDYEYEYCEDIFNEYDEKLINILKKDKMEICNAFVLSKIKDYNKCLKKLDLDNIFCKTIEYLKNPNNPNNCLTNDEIVELFKHNFDDAVIQFNQIDNFKDILYIYNNLIINNEHIVLLSNKIDSVIINNNNDFYINKCIFFIIHNTTDLQIIKKYGLISIDFILDFDIFIKIKPLCDKDELQIILNKILKNQYIDNHIFNILYDYELFEDIYNLLNKDLNHYNIDTIIQYYNLLILKIPDKIIGLIKINIDNILEKSISKHYDDVIEYLKILKNNSNKNDFITYTTTLMKLHSKKTKFKKLFINSFN